MTIRAKLIFLSVFLSIIIFAVIAANLYFSRAVTQEIKKDAMAQELARSIAELSLLTESYISHQEARKEIQWLSRAERIKDAMNRPDIPDDITSMLLVFDSLTRAFAILRENHHQISELMITDNNDEEIRRLQEVAERISSRMRMDTQNLLSRMFVVASQAQEKSLLLQQRNFRIVAGLGIFLFVASLFLLIILGLNISQGINALVAGTDRMGQGKLDYRIPNKRRDELGKLAKSFNYMAQSIQNLVNNERASSKQLSLEISEKELIQSILKESEKRYRSLVELAPEAIIVQSQGKIVYMNPAGLRLLGYDNLEQVKGRELLDFIHPEDRPGVIERLKELSAGQERVPPREQRMLRVDGQSVDVEVSAGSITYGGKPAAQAFVRDITEMIQHRRYITELNLRLEDKVRERTAQLEEANKELESFSYSVSHDLRSPLRAINGFTRILVEDYGSSLDDEGRRICKVITDNAVKMGQLIDDILKFSRLSRTSMSLSDVNMQDLTESVYKELVTGYAPDIIDFQVDPLPMAYGDPALLRQVWKNLLSNALKYTSKKDNPEIRVRAWEDDQEVVYQVIDNGSGFDEAYADKLFGVFQRLHTEAEFPGTGVGLAIVQRIVNRHNGRVWAEGVVDKGAKFNFSLPLKKE